VRLLGSGPILRLALRAQELLAEKYGIAADVYSATSYQQLRSDALAAERWNRLHPAEPARVPYVSRVLGESEGPVVAVSDFMKMVPEQIARWVPGTYVPLGTDGFGRSDTREALREWCEIDVPSIVVAALGALAREGKMLPETVAQAIRELEVDPEKGDPARV
jgi:pyruvate dehydrogenase E1 component